jgi:hypothetical protein
VDAGRPTETNQSRASRGGNRERNVVDGTILRIDCRGAGGASLTTLKLFLYKAKGPLVLTLFQARFQHLSLFVSQLFREPNVELDPHVAFRVGGFGKRHACDCKKESQSCMGIQSAECGKWKILTFANQLFLKPRAHDFGHVHVDRFPVKRAYEDFMTEQGFVKIHNHGFYQVVPLAFERGVFLFLNHEDDIRGGYSWCQKRKRVREVVTRISGIGKGAPFWS